jgi:hypothetical protein
MSVKVYTSVELEPIECCNCGTIFGASPQWITNRCETKATFYCPNGHPQSYKQSTAERLREELEAEKRKLASAQFEVMAAKERAASLEKSKAKLEKRVKNGVCPCCHRSFIQLTRHMKTKHPDFDS